ncbi:11310_t:CDS:1, partial [Funneliformis caledonium]
ILMKSTSDVASSCLIQAIKPERNFKKTDLLEFLIKRVDKGALKNALDHYKVGFKFNAESIKTTKKIRSLTVHSNLYYWILKKYGPNSEVTQKCFDDIIESRIWVDLKLQKTPDREVPEGLTIGAFNSICSIYLEFCNEKVPFKANILQYLQLINNYEIINPFFNYCIWYTINRGITFDD